VTVIIAPPSPCPRCGPCCNAEIQDDESATCAGRCDSEGHHHENIGDVYNAEPCPLLSKPAIVGNLGTVARAPAQGGPTVNVSDLPRIVEATVLRVQPGDSIVLTVDADLTRRDAEKLRAAWQSAVRGSDAEMVPVVVMSERVSLTIARVEQP
jgi:hypothetical protein